MRLHLLVLLFTFPWCFTVKADQWLPATPETYSSRHGVYRLTIFPKQLDGALPYFQDKATGKKPAGQSLKGRTRCEATLERLVDGLGRYEQLWRKPLVNDVAPVSALVSDVDGSFVTFDNWHSMGWGDDVIVIYAGSGALKKKLALTDIMSEADFNKFPRTASSIWWSGKHELDYDGRTLNVQIVAAEGISAGEIIEGHVESDGSFRTIRIDLGTAKTLK